LAVESEGALEADAAGAINSVATNAVAPRTTIFLRANEPRILPLKMLIMKFTLLDAENQNLISKLD
jgi:hypothetical protein